MRPAAVKVRSSSTASRSFDTAPYGQITSDYTDGERRFTKGHMALQQFGTGTDAEFRKIEIKELP